MSVLNMAFLHLLSKFQTSLTDIQMLLQWDFCPNLPFQYPFPKYILMLQSLNSWGQKEVSVFSHFMISHSNALSSSAHYMDVAIFHSSFQSPVFLQSFLQLFQFMHLLSSEELLYIQHLLNAKLNLSNCDFFLHRDFWLNVRRIIRI